MNENEEFEFRYRLEQEQAARAKPQAVAAPKTSADYQREVLAEMPWLQRQTVAAGGQLASAWEGLKSLVPGVEVDKDVIQAAKVAAQEAPVGAFVGDVAKFAPAALAPATIPAQMAAAGAIGAATAPQDRVGAGVMDAAGAGIASGAVKGIQKLAGSGSLDRARRALSSILGGDEQQAAQLARQAVASGQPVSTSQALADLDNATLASLGEAMKGTGRGAAAAESAAYYRQLAAAQQAAREAELARLARGATAEESAASRQLMRQNLEGALGPLREQELAAANIAANVTSRLAPKAAQKEASMIQALQDTGKLYADEALLRNQLISKLESKTPGWVKPETISELEQSVLKQRSAVEDMNAFKWQRQDERDFINRQIESLKDYGLRTIDTSAIINRIGSMLQSPKTGVSDVNQKVLGRVADKIREWSKGGTIDANALYQIRKESINEAIDDLMRGVDPKTSRQVAAKLTSQIRPMIDDAIENAGGTEWKQYITKYSKGLEAIDRVELLDVARNLHRTNPKAFTDLVKGESPEIVQKIMSGKAGVKDALSPSTMRKLENIAGQVQRDARLADMATDPAGKRALAEIIGSEGMTTKLPPLLNRYMVIANTAIKSGEMKVNRGMYKELEKAMRDPQAFLTLIERLPPEQRSKMVGAIVEAQRSGATAVGGAAAADTMIQQ